MELSPGRLKVKVKRERVTAVCKVLLEQLPVEDISIEDISIDDVIRNLFSSRLSSTRAWFFA